MKDTRNTAWGIRAGMVGYSHKMCTDINGITTIEKLSTDSLEDTEE